MVGLVCWLSCYGEVIVLAWVVEKSAQVSNGLVSGRLELILELLVLATFHVRLLFLEL